MIRHISRAEYNLLLQAFRSHNHSKLTASLPSLPSPLQLLATFSASSSLSLVLEYLTTDLEAIIRDKSLVFKTADVKSWLGMTLRGLEFCHERGVLHRVSEHQF